VQYALHVRVLVASAFWRNMSVSQSILPRAFWLCCRKRHHLQLSALRMHSLRRGGTLQRQLRSFELFERRWSSRDRMA
jgi:hypothetical protein